MSSGIPGLSTNTESTSWSDYFTPRNLALLSTIGLVTLVAIKRLFNPPQQEALAHNPLQGANRQQSLDALDPDNQKWDAIRAANQVYVSSSDDEGEGQDLINPFDPDNQNWRNSPPQPKEQEGRRNEMIRRNQEESDDRYRRTPYRQVGVVHPGEERYVNRVDKTFFPRIGVLPHRKESGDPQFKTSYPPSGNRGVRPLLSTVAEVEKPSEDQVQLPPGQNEDQPGFGNAGVRPPAFHSVEPTTPSVVAAGKAVSSEILPQGVLNVKQAKGILMLWCILAQGIKKEVPGINLKGNDRDHIELAQQFPSWVNRHRQELETIITKLRFSTSEGSTAHADHSLFRLSVKEKAEKELFTQFLEDDMPELPLPTGIFNFLPNLSSLTLTLSYGCFKLEAIPDEIQELKKLTTLTIRNSNNLQTIPSFIYDLSELVSLELKDLKLDDLPYGINKLTKLEKLNLFDNELREVPLEIFELKGLTNLTLSSNPISELPPEISQLENLGYLALGNTNITTLPKELLSLKKLRMINLPPANQIDEAGIKIAQALEDKGVKVSFSKVW